MLVFGGDILARRSLTFGCKVLSCTVPQRRGGGGGLKLGLQEYVCGQSNSHLVWRPIISSSPTGGGVCEMCLLWQPKCQTICT